MPGDELVYSTLIPPPILGLYEGVEPSLPDEEMPPHAAPDLQNVRVYRGLWETRFGSALYHILPGFGASRWFYPQYQTDGKRVRLAARGDGTGAILYKLVEGVDPNFTATSGGTGLGGTTQPYFKGVSLRDRVYFTDRFGALRRFELVPVSGNQVRPVAQPVAPVAAPTVKPRWYDVVDDWSTLAGWTMSNSGRFEITSVTSTDPVPDGGNVARLNVKNTSAAGETITKNVAGQVLNSFTIACWIRSDTPRGQVTFGVGIGAADEFIFQLRPSPTNEWLPLFMDVGNIPTINFKRFRVTLAKYAPDNYFLGPLYLPGRLEGAYRWVYTHYDPTTGRESAPSLISGGGTPTDLSAIGKTNEPGTSQAFQKSALLSFVSDSGTDASTTQVRFYRNGGTPELTVDDRGRDVWYLVGTVGDVSTTLNGGVSAGATSVIVTSASGISIGDTLVLDKGVVGTEEFVRVTNVAGTTLTLKFALLNNHSNGAAVQMAFHDNVPNAQVDTSRPIDLSRNDPPTAARWIARSPDGRLWLFNFTGHPTGIAISNRSTPDRLEDYEVFPDGVDPLVSRSLIQGWRADIGGDINDEEIMWGGFYAGWMHVLTRRNLYRISAFSQLDWGPSTVYKIHNVGCIAGDTVAEVNGTLTWVAEGPRVMEWDGSGEPKDISILRTNLRLYAAAPATWVNWFAVYHAKRDGHYYCLFFTPSGASGNTQRLDYNVDANLWEVSTYNLTGAATPTLRRWQVATVFDSLSDSHQLYQIDDTGRAYQTEVGNTDDGAPISILFKTKRFSMLVFAGYSSLYQHRRSGHIALLQEAYLRLDGVASDTVNLQVTTGGSGDYPQTVRLYSQDLSGAVDLYLRQKLDRDLQGRWYDVQVSGDVSNRPAFKEVEIYWLAIRPRRATDG